MNYENKKIIAIFDKDKFKDIEQILFSTEYNLKTKIFDAADFENAEVIFLDKEKLKELENIKEKDKFILVLNQDDEKIFDAVKELEFEKMTYGFSENSDFMASDVNETEEGINFKLNYRGNSIPIWLKNKSGNDKIYEALAIICIANILGINILEIAEKIKN